MHRLMAGVTILEHELSELRLLVERQTGILLDCPNSALAAHVADYLESHELESAACLLAQLREASSDPSIFCTFLDGVLNVNTGFYRHPGAMNALARQVVPQLYARKSDDGLSTLRIWSAGCSTGEEAYSIAMALCDAYPVANGNGSANGNGTREPRAKNAAAQWWHCRSWYSRQRRMERLVHPYCRQRPAAFRDCNCGAWPLPAIGSDGIAALDDSRFVFENRKSQRRPKWARGRFSIRSWQWIE